MRAVLTDLAIETEAANALWPRLARAFEGAKAGCEHEAAVRRVATAVGKYWICKRAPLVAYEAMECVGGNGYVEDGPLSRLYRQAPLNAIWEGSGNVIALDVLRSLRSEPHATPALLNEISACRGADSRLDGLADNLAHELAAATDGGGYDERRGRLLCDQLAIALQATALVRHGHPAAAAAFCAARLPRGRELGAWNLGAFAASDLGAQSGRDTLLERLMPLS